MKPRLPWLAAVLNLFASGLGYLYIGRAPRFFALFGGAIALYLVFGWTGVLSSFNGFCAMMLFGMAFKLFLAVDSYRLARKQPLPSTRVYMKWYIYCAHVVFIFALFHLLQVNRGTVFGYEVFSLPSDAMAPALRQNEIIHVDTRYYRDHEPEPGDVVVIRDNGTAFVRRIKAPTGNGYEVEADNKDGVMQDPGSPVVSAADIIGRVTGVFFSPRLERIGLPLPEAGDEGKTAP